MKILDACKIALDTAGFDFVESYCDGGDDFILISRRSDGKEFGVGIDYADWDLAGANVLIYYEGKEDEVEKEIIVPAVWLKS